MASLITAKVRLVMSMTLDFEEASKEELQLYLRLHLVSVVSMLALQAKQQVQSPLGPYLAEALEAHVGITNSLLTIIQARFGVDISNDEAVLEFANLPNEVLQTYIVSEPEITTTEHS